jgi:hypothetical protein
VVRIEQHAHAGGLRAARHREDARQVAVAGGRIDPQPKPDPIGAVGGEDLLRQRGATAIGVGGAGRRLLDGEGEVVADDRRPRGAPEGAQLGDARAAAGPQAHGAGEERAVGGQPRGRADRDGGRDPPSRRLDRHARRRGVAREADAEALDPTPLAEVDGHRIGAAGRGGGVAVVDGGRAGAAGQGEVDEGTVVVRGGRRRGGGEAGEDGEGEATRGHAPPMPRGAAF